MDKKDTVFWGLIIVVVVAFLAVVIAYFGMAVLSTDKDKEAEITEVTSILPVRITVDPANGFICYDNINDIDCSPLMWGVPPPDVFDYLQSRIGRVFSYMATPTPSSFLDGTN